MNRNDFYFMTAFATFSIGVTYFRLYTYMENWLVYTMDTYPITGICFFILLLMMLYNLIAIVRKHKIDRGKASYSDIEGKGIKRNDFYFMISFAVFTLNTLQITLRSRLFGIDSTDNAIFRMRVEYPIVSLLYVINIIIMVYHLVKLVKQGSNNASKNI